MKRAGLLVIFFLYCLIANSTTYSNYTNNQLFLTKLNEYRISLGLSPLVYDYKLEKAAELQAVYNLENNKTTDLHGNKSLPHTSDRIQKIGINANNMIIGECAYALLNITKSIPNIEDRILNGYINSEKHNFILTDNDYQRIGMFTVFLNGDLYSVTVFMNGKAEKTTLPIETKVKTEADENIPNFCNSESALKLINEYRKANKLNPLKYSKDLEKAAKIQAIYNSRDYKGDTDAMIDGIFAVHIHPKYKKVSDRVKAINPNTHLGGFGEISAHTDRVYNHPEVFKVAFPNGIEVRCIEALKSSKPHNALILKQEYEEIGIYAVHTDDNVKRLSFVVVFGY